MNKENFTWISFYKELAEKLLEYKGNRKELVDFVYDENGLAAYTAYLHMEDKTEKITDIDPFSFFAIFNRGIKTRPEKRISILEKIKRKFCISAEIPKDFSGIPSMVAIRSFFFNWNYFENICNDLWSAYECLMGGKSLKEFFEKERFSDRKAELTMPLFWIKPESYLPLDKNNKSYLEEYGLSAKNVLDYDAYMNLLRELKDKMSSGLIKEKSFMEFSYNARQKGLERAI